ncbi:MAG: hypothetical protein Q9198_001341 [Flavoplaca austrocitrina]
MADMKDVDWTSEPECLKRIAKDGDLTVLDSMVEPPNPEVSGASREKHQRGRGRGQRGDVRDNGRGSGRGHGRVKPRLEAFSSSSNLDNTHGQSVDKSQHSKTPNPQETVASGTEKISTVISWLLRYHQKVRLKEVFSLLLSAIRAASTGNYTIPILDMMIGFLQRAPYLVVTFLDLGPWMNLPSSVSSFLASKSLEMLEAFCLVANEMQVFVVEPFRTFLLQVRHIPLSSFGFLVRHICLVVRFPETALDLLMGVLELESSRLLVGRPTLITYFVANIIGVALEHIDEAKDSRAVREDELQLKFDSATGIVSSRLRIDSHSKVRIAVNDHVELTAASLPTNSLETKPYMMNALIQLAEPGKVVFRCFHPLPPYMEDCAWKVKNCGSFVTSQAMFEALERFVTESGEFCPIHNHLMGFGSYVPLDTSRIESYQDGDLTSSSEPSEPTIVTAREPWRPSARRLDDVNQSTSEMSATGLNSGNTVANEGPLSSSQRVDLNESQNKALQAALDSSLTCLWGPPGTGKTHTVAVILEELLKNPERRILVTAPTHNAVRKVAEDLRKYTCDAMMGKDLNEDPASRRKAQKRIKDCRLIFTTCIGAALGLLKSEIFDTVIIDEASQQTEPQSLVPLTKGCTKAILVGDHVQLRATVQQHAQLVGFDVSMFERLYNSPTDEARLRKVMLDTQYRMQASICQFSSQEFYENKLRTAVRDGDRPLKPRSFPWPEPKPEKLNRMFFVQCSATEDLGQRSKSNQGQAALCREICKALQQPPDNTPSGAPDAIPSIAVLAPYARQVETLKDLNSPNLVVSSIDGFQGREADVVVYCTTRCNVHADIGFLKDLRRLNVVLTRARCACIVIGDQATLTSGDVKDEATGVWRRLLGAMTVMVWEDNGGA